MVIAGNESVCDRLMNEDVMTVLLAQLQKVCVCESVLPSRVSLLSVRLGEGVRTVRAHFSRRGGGGGRSDKSW